MSVSESDFTIVDDLDTPQSIDLPPMEPGVFSAEQAATPYVRYVISTSFHTRTGLAGIPVAGVPGTSCRIVRHSAPITLKVVRWLAERIGAKPQLPHWDNDNSNEVLLYMEVTPTNPQPEPGVDYRWRVEGVYVYQLQVAANDGATPSATVPAVTLPVANTQLDASLFIKGLLGTLPANGSVLLQPKSLAGS